MEGFMAATNVEYAAARDYFNSLLVVAFQTQDLLEGGDTFLERRELRCKG